MTAGPTAIGADGGEVLVEDHRRGTLRGEQPPMAFAIPVPGGGRAAVTWTDEAACRGRLELFYAPLGERPPARLRREAEGRRVCATCPVTAPCREQARAHGELGLWAGETEEDRATIEVGATSAPPGASVPPTSAS